MVNYDVIVVGAGPAGCAAARSAAEKGCKTILIEEHKTIGFPAHCTGYLSSNERPDILEATLESMDKRVVIRHPSNFSSTHVYAPSGSILRTDPWPSYLYLVDRSLFDQELVRQAIRAGAELKINTRVTCLIKRDGRVIGVKTNSKSLPEVFGDVVIAADGISGGVRGIAKWEGLIDTDQRYVGGITMTLAGVKNCDRYAGLYTGSYLLKGWFQITPCGIDSCIVQFMTLDEYRQVKKGDTFLSAIMKDAVPIRMDGWRHTANLGVRFPEIVRDGLILTGSAANWRGTIISMVSGIYAGETAAEAVQEGDVTAERLGKFITLYEESGLINELYQHSSWLDSRPLAGCSDDEIEKWLRDMLKNGITYIPSAPVRGVHGRA
jgi:flavin-dependent dehydrogenase